MTLMTFVTNHNSPRRANSQTIIIHNIGDVIISQDEWMYINITQ